MHLKKTKPSPVAVRPSTFAALYDLAPSTVYDAIERRDLPVIRIGRNVRIPLTAIDELLTTRKASNPTQEPLT